MSRETGNYTRHHGARWLYSDYGYVKGRTKQGTPREKYLSWFGAYSMPERSEKEQKLLVYELSLK